jgi:hypothetical protein
MHSALWQQLFLVLQLMLLWLHKVLPRFRSSGLFQTMEAHQSQPTEFTAMEAQAEPVSLR